MLARRGGPDHWPHVIIYGHYDVQPADPLNLWQSAPFEPEIRGERIYGRGAADNKGPMMVHVAAVARLLEKRPDLPLRITFLIEGEEEMGSPSFPGFLAEYRDTLKKADFVFLSDTGIPNPDQVVITCGLRGLVLSTWRLPERRAICTRAYTAAWCAIRFRHWRSCVRRCTRRTVA